MSLRLVKLSETEFKITLGWTPVPGAIGYRFQSSLQAPKWSHTWDGGRSQVTFAKADWYKVEALGVEDVGEYPTSQPSTISDLPSSKVTLSGNQIAAWFAGKSPTTQIRPSNNARDKQRCIAWGPGDLYQSADTHIIWQFRLNRGYFGRGYDPHIVGGESYGDSVSPTAVDFWGDSRGLHIVLAADGYRQLRIMSTEEYDAKWRGKILTLSMVWRMGRRGTPRPGALKVRVDDEPSWRIDEGDLNMHYPGQTAVSVWEGAYWNKHHYPQPVEIEFAASRIGRTAAECYADRPTVAARDPAGNDFGPGGEIVAIPNLAVPDVRVLG